MLDFCYDKDFGKQIVFDRKLIRKPPCEPRCRVGRVGTKHCQVKKKHACVFYTRSFLWVNHPIADSTQEAVLGDNKIKSPLLRIY